MKKVLVLMMSICSIQAGASVCTEPAREIKALLAATQMEMLSGGGAFLTREIVPMSTADFYKIRFGYSGIQRSWRVFVDHQTCEVTQVRRW